MKRLCNAACFIFLIIACNNPEKKAVQIAQKDSLQIKNSTRTDTLPAFDTTIVLKKIPLSTFPQSNAKLTMEVARSIVYSYFKKQGINNEFEKVNTSEEAECVQWDTAYFVNINQGNFTDAIVLYWLHPCFGSSHYDQPKNGIVIRMSDKYQLINENFLPDKFHIDSARNGPDNNAVIYGVEYDADFNKIIQKFRAILINK
jgi:hypothetical protein